MKTTKYKLEPDNYFIKTQLEDIVRLYSTKEGSELDPELVTLALQKILKNNFDNIKKEDVAETIHLRWYAKDLKIPACEGGEKASLYYASDIFDGYIDYNLKEFGLNTSQKKTEEVSAEIWGMIPEDNIFCNPFLLFNSTLQRLKWDSQEQIKMFCSCHPRWFEKGHGYYFLFSEEKSGENIFFEAFIRKDVCELGGKPIPKEKQKMMVCVYKVNPSEHCWWNGCGHRIVVPSDWRK